MNGLLLLTLLAPAMSPALPAQPGDKPKPVGSLEDVKAELRVILKNQQALQQEVEVLVGKVKQFGHDVLKEAQVNDDMRKTAELQGRLATQMETLVEQMNQLRQQMKGKDDATAELLGKVIKIAHNPEEFQDIVLEMRDTAMRQLSYKHDRPAAQVKKLLGPNPQCALANQSECVQYLEAMLKVLDAAKPK
jgi:hypothetical protein